MKFQLEAITEPGRRLVTLAEELAADFATRAAQHDREGSFAHENVEALRRTGYLAAPIPVECGGLGVDSLHDILVASTRLARGDASTTIGVNMHLGNALRQVRGWRRALAGGDRARAARFADAMEQIAAGDLVIAAGITEAGRELTEPATTARREGDGWVIDGAKIFGTFAPGATHLTVSATLVDEEGEDRYGMFAVPVAAAGVSVNDDWDALGMRGSGSGSIALRAVHVPASALRGEFPVGEWNPPVMERYMNAGLLHASASLGVAEAAHALAIKGAATQRKGRYARPLAERPTIQILAAENAIDMAAMRAVFARAALLVDCYVAEHMASIGPDEEVCAVFTETQSAKTFVHLAALRIVDRAMTMFGGAGFMTKHPLSRLYRDVRAGPFMHPLGVNVAYEFIGQVILGLEPKVA
ncbi:MAG: acyl-CoA dehydrogenase family protein [Dehalococcoidia bacterium]